MVSRRAVLATAAARTTLAGSWRRLPAAPLPRGTGQLTAAWTGSKMILYGRGSRNVAAAYAPATNTWRRLSPPRGPGGAYEGTNRSVWTGTEMLVAGIPNVAYNPLTDRWRRLPRAPLSLVTGLVVWTGREVIGWGGGCCGEASNGGAAYDPATGSSRTLAASPLAARQQVTGAWTGTELIVAGGADANGHAFRGAAAYNPRSDTWRRIAPLPVPRRGAIAAWTGREVLVVGGRGAAVGFAYNPATDRWRRLPRMESGRWDTDNSAAVWTGTRLLVWGGQTVRSRGGVLAPRGLAYDPAGNRWSALPLSPLRGRPRWPLSSTTAVWTGRQMIVWRGVGDGAAFTPRAP
jgi:hypothetical protein